MNSTDALRLIAATLVAAAIALGCASTAQAGSYFTRELAPWKGTASAGLAVGNDGRLIARNAATPGVYVPRGTAAEWRVEPPPNSRFANPSIAVAALRGGFGWQVVWSDGNNAYQPVCGGSTGPACSDRTAQALNGLGGPGGLAVQLRCDADQCPLSAEAVGQFVIVEYNAEVINDTPPSSVSLAGGTARNDRWLSGKKTIVIAAADDVGIRRVAALLDGTPIADTGLRCAQGNWVPCPTRTSGTTIALDLTKTSDGIHSLVGSAVDSASNQRSTGTRRLRVDNTPPTPPQSLSVDAGTAWRTTNAFTVRWVNPTERFAPIAGVDYAICRTGTTTCIRGSKRAANLSALDGLQVPGPGSWTVQVRLVDAAGNTSASASSTVDGLRYDPSAPSVDIQQRDPRDPARIVARAADGESGLAAGSIEVRRAGAPTWRQVATRLTASEMTAVLPDRRLPRGSYEVRALASNGAGLTAVAQMPGQVAFPIRARSRLTGGYPVAKRRRNGKRVTRLRRSVNPTIGRRVLLRGRLTVKGKPLAGRTINIATRTAVEGSSFAPAGRTRTDGRGRYIVRLPTGPARTVRLVYGGAARVADSQVDVQVRVRSKLRLRIDDRRVRNGETVTLSGRVRGGQLPPDGVQLALQVFTRGKWRPFATPRTDDTGRFSFPYRFETVLGTARFRFRAVVLKGATYPYYGRSDERRVTVRGL